MPLELLSARAIFAARLAQARQLRGLSQRALGDRMGLGKDKGSSRINRYERQVTAVGFDNLERLAEILEVPPAYLLASTSELADAILAFSTLSTEQQSRLASALNRVTEDSGAEASLVHWLDQVSPKR
ncbi:helix-turn-helix transcriptional regulator [Xanthomonas campestris pv. raphani]|uniref:helix-turn-helix domain-containing protein n=1 Tax=Xanthomonas campestris TaxID=339 RepID=UPI002B23A601|nr:helix-turn-helix transcriptional regulator [Xanthomonas campestris]MEA9787036.1 helix-turn-helix transcriptional regulator [Xanthomonas campestris pv. raphani]